MRGAVVALFIVTAVGACGTFLAAPVDPLGRDDGGLDGASVDGTPDGSSGTPDAGDDAVGNNKSRLVFVTNDEVSAEKLAGTLADDLCNEEAADANSHAKLKGKRFLAWLSTLTTNAADRFAHSQSPYLRTDDKIVAANYNELISGKLQNPISIDSTGGNLSGSTSNVWTGTRADGTAMAETCVDWSKTSGVGWYGVVSAIDDEWTQSGTESCESPNRVYCIEE